MPTVKIELKGRTEDRELTQNPVTIGRSRSSDIRIVHPSVSGRHARLEWNGGQLRLLDEGSRHGIKVGDERVSAVDVTDGLAVTIGKARLTFKTGGGQARAECLQWLQLPDPGRSGISPPPAPGSGLGTTPSTRASRSLGARPALTPAGRILELANSAGSFVVSFGLHAFVALILSFCLYKELSKPVDKPVTVSIAKPKANPFELPERFKEGAGAGSPLGKTEVAERPKFQQAAARDVSSEIPLVAAELEEGSASAPAKRAGRGPAMAMGPAMTKRTGMKRLPGKFEPLPDDGSWEFNERAKQGVRSGQPIDIGKDDDPAELVRGNLEQGRQGGWQTVAQMEAKEIVVVNGEYDHVQRVLDKLRVRYTTCEPRKLDSMKLSGVRVILLNCPGQLDASGELALQRWVVKGGGWLVSTDWALEAVMHCFPGHLESAGLTEETWVKIGPAEGAAEDPLLKDVFNFKGEMPKWYLEARSYAFRVQRQAQDKVKVLIESEEMRKKTGSGTVAVRFDVGHGHVLHIISHLQQVSTDPKSHYAMYQLVANWLVQAAAGREEKADDGKKK